MPAPNIPQTISQAVTAYLAEVEASRSQNTLRSYRNAMNAFALMLDERGLPCSDTGLGELTEDAIAWFAAALKDYAPATEQLYLTAASGFFDYLAAERLAEPNLPRLRWLIHQRSRRPGQRLPQFPRNMIEAVIEYANSLANAPAEDGQQRLINLRDRAFLLTLADTGLRVHEACKLRRGDIDWNEGKAVIIGKGNREAVVRFSSRSMAALKDYLAVRSALDGASGRPLTSLPLFARHDRGAGRKVKPVTTTTGRAIVDERARQAAGPEAGESITPHSFRHYFVTTVLRSSGGNLKLAQELARHQNIAITQRYAHLSDDDLDQGYWEIFEAGSQPFRPSASGDQK